MEGLRRREVHTSSPGGPDSPCNPLMPFRKVEGKSEKKPYNEKRRVRKREINLSQKIVPFTRTFQNRYIIMKAKGKILHYRQINNRQ